jgi:hypothetical protein
MLGTKTLTGVLEIIDSLIDDCLTALQCKRAMGMRARKYARWSEGIAFNRTDKQKGVSSRSLAKEIRLRRRCLELAKQFPVVKLDATVKRYVKTSCGGKIEAPLVFHTRLPAKPIMLQEVVYSGYRYNVSAKVPHPPEQAIQAIKEHGQKFDWLEVWWVPSDVLVEKIPDPDPILVGAVKHPYADQAMYHFELHRWIDESVELGYWSKEGY